MRDAITRLLTHLEWADRAVLETLRSGSPPPRAMDLYAHVLGAEHVWLARLRQAEPRYAVWPSLDAEQCAALAAENVAGFRTFLDVGDADRLAEQIPYTNSAGLHFTSRVDDILLHVALHGCYHRGQIALLLRTAGLPPAPTDYIGFVRGVPAAVRQD